MLCKDETLVNKQTSVIRTMEVRLGCRFAMAAAIVAVALAFAPVARPAAAAADPVLAEVGSYKITQQEVDARLKVQLYEVRKRTLDKTIDDYLLQQAAKKDKLSVAEYLKREVDDKVATDLTGISPKFKKYYDENKDKLPEFKGVPYDEAKDRMMAAVRRRVFLIENEELVARLRKEAGVKILLQQPRVEVASVGHPMLGPPNAPVKVVEFGDFQCPYCGRTEDTLKAMREKYGDKVQLVFMDFPLSFHAHAMQAARGARCAQEQNKFWQYHDALFADQSKLAPDDLKATAKRLGLNMEKFDACFDSGKYDDAIHQDMAEGSKLNVSGTPTFFIDGRELTGARPLPQFQEIIDDELARVGNHGAKKTAAAK